MPRGNRPTDDEYAELNHSTSTNAALLPEAAPMGGGGGNNNNNNNNGFLRNSPKNESSAFPILCENDTEPSASSDVLMTELGHQPRVVHHPAPARAAGGGGGGARSKSKSGGSSICYYLRRYRCQMIFVLIAFVEFGLLIAGLTFYFAGVLTATCDSRQGEAAAVAFIH